MNEESAGRELAGEFHRLMEHEPPFRTDLNEALRLAERGGRRRRHRTLAVRSGSAVMAIAASTVLVLAWPDHDRALSNPPAWVVPTEVTSTHVPPTVQPADPIDRLERMAREIARPSGGAVKARWDAEQEEMTATVKTDGGSFEVSASLSGDNDARTWRESCRLDGSTCKELSFTPAIGVWSRKYPAQPGRESLLLVAKAQDGKWLTTKIDNLVEVASGAKNIGPTWKDAGITASGLRKAAAGSGLTTTPSN
jgi:hypothetical protein